MGAALRAQHEGRRLGDSLTTEQIELVTIGCGGPDDFKPPPVAVVVPVVHGDRDSAP